MRRATSRMRSGLPMEVPPYFWTMSDTGGGAETAKPAFYPALQHRASRDAAPRLLGAAKLAAGVVQRVVSKRRRAAFRERRPGTRRLAGPRRGRDLCNALHFAETRDSIAAQRRTT